MIETKDEERIEELRRERLEELRDRQETGDTNREAQERAREEAEAQKQALLRQSLTDGARKRLNALRMSKPGFAKQVEQQLVTLAQSGRLAEQIDETRMKQLLRELAPESQGYNIKHR